MYSESSESDEEVLDYIARIERPRIFRPRPDPFEIYGEADFRSRYRLTKRTVQLVINLLEEDLVRATNRNGALTPSQQVLMALRFYSTGSFQILVGDDSGVHKSTVCRIVFHVTNSLGRCRPQFINFPHAEGEKRKIKEDIFGISGFPNVMGCIDGTHIRIISPGGDNAELFRNRKGFFSINVQVVADASLLIRDIDARWPGSAHDSTILNASFMGARLAAGEFPGSYVLGDSAYPCTQYLMTPLLNPTSPEEHNYNDAHIRTRNCVERTFGVWKKRFACLSIGLRTRVERTLKIIVATAVLHNIAIHEKELIEVDEEDEVAEEPVINYEANLAGNAVRRALINQIFR